MTTQSSFLKFLVLFLLALSFIDASYASPPEITPPPTDIVLDTQTNSFTFLVFDPADNNVQVSATGLPPGYQLKFLGWKVSTVAGNGASSFKDGPALSAGFYAPYDVALDGAGNIIVADTWNNRIRKIDSLGNVSTIAGTGQPGSLDGPALSATFSHPAGLAIDSQGNIFIAGLWSHKIRKLDINGNVSTFAGTGKQGFLDGPGSIAEFNGPREIEFDPSGNLIVVEEKNRAIRKIEKNGNVTTIAGKGVFGNKDGPANIAEFKDLWGLGIDNLGNIYVADPNNESIRKIDSKNNVTTVKEFLSVNDYQYPHDIVFDNLNNAFFSYQTIGNPTNSYIEFLQGQNPGYFRLTVGGAAFGLTSDDHRNLFLANHGANIIQKISGPYYEISGTYTGNKCGGDFPVTIRATDSNGEYTEASFTITIPRQVPEIMCLENLSDTLANPKAPGGVISETGNIRDDLIDDIGEVLENPSVVTGTIGIDPNDPRIIQVDPTEFERDPGLVFHNPGGVGIPAAPVNLAISKEIGVCDAQGTCTYTITVENTGGSPFYGPVIIEDTFTFGSAANLDSFTPSNAQCFAPSSFSSKTTLVCGVVPNPMSFAPFPPGAKQNFTATFSGLNLAGDIPRLDNCAQFYSQMPWFQHRLIEALIAKGYTFTTWSPEELDAALKDYAAKNNLPFGQGSSAVSMNDMGGFGPVSESLLGLDFVWDPDLSNEPSDDPSDNKACASFQPPPPPEIKYDLAIKKEAAGIRPEDWFAGPFLFGYEITVTNVGQGSVKAPNTIVVADDLPPWFTPYDAKGTFWKCSFAGQILSCEVPLQTPLKPGASLPKILVRGTLEKAETGPMDNCASVGSDFPDLDPSNDTSCVRVFVTKYDIGIVKTYSGMNPATNEHDFMVRPTNYGATLGAKHSVRIVDTLPADLTPTWAGSGLDSGWACSISGQTVECTYSGPDIQKGDIFPPIDIRAIPKGPGDYTNCAKALVQGNTDSNPTNNNACVSFTSKPDPKPAFDLALEKTLAGNFSNWRVGPSIHGFNIKITNVGTKDLKAPDKVTFYDTLPAGFTPIDAKGSFWQCTFKGQDLTCEIPLLLPLKAGKSLPPVLISGTLEQASPGDMRNCATVQAQNPDADPSNNEGCVTVGVKEYDLGWEKSYPAFSNTTNEYLFNLTVKNLGDEVSGAGSTTITDTLPSGLVPTQVDFVPNSGWACSIAGQDVECTYSGPAIQKGNDFPTVQVRSVPDGPGNYNNCAMVALSAPWEFNTANNSVCVTVRVQ